MGVCDHVADVTGGEVEDAIPCGDIAGCAGENASVEGFFFMRSIDNLRKSPLTAL